MPVTLCSNSRQNTDIAFKIRLRDIYFATESPLFPAAWFDRHYFYQDLWAAKTVHSAGVKHHVDVGSRVDGFVAHILTFSSITYVDVRPLQIKLDGLTVCRASALEMPFASNSIQSLSCLHVIEHIGLGRYGDRVNPDGYMQAASEFVRVLRPGGMLLVGAPVGEQRVCFDAHRVFHPRTIVTAFSGLQLLEFVLIDDKGAQLAESDPWPRASNCDYGCGLFRFAKPTWSGD